MGHLLQTCSHGLVVFFAMTLMVASPALAESSTSGILSVSEELFQLLEEWSSPTVNLESVALEKFPETVELYASSVDDLYPQGLANHVEEAYPEAYLDYLDIQGEPEDLSALVAFLMSQEIGTYAAWQKESLLEDDKLTFAKYVSRKFPEILVALDDDAQTPASKNVSFYDFVIDKIDYPDHPLSSEATALLADVDAFPVAPDFDCVCWVALAFTRAPSGWQHDLPSPQHTSRRWAGIKELEIDYEAQANGAISDVEFHRLSKHNLFTWNPVRASSRTTMRARMHCTKQGIPGGQECQGAGCTTELATRVEYGSRVFEENYARGFGNHGAESLASDYAELIHTSETEPAESLFRKGVRVAGSTSTSWDPEALGQILSSVASVVAVAVGVDGTSVANLISGDLMNDTIEGIFGLIVREGEPSILNQTMRVAFDSISDPIDLEPNETHNFDLVTTSEVLSKGYGEYSETWAEVQSYNAFAAVLRNSTCTNTAPPPPGACWYYESSGAPHNNDTLRDMVGSYIDVEMGVRPSNTDLTDLNGLCPRNLN